MRFAGQAAAYAAFALVIGWFSSAPVWRHTDPGRAQIKLSLRHAGEKASECRRLSPEEIAALPPNMRKPMDCPRGRVPVALEVEIDGAPVLAESLPPAGLSGDGASSAYHRFQVDAGEHRIVARLRDSRRAEGFDYQGETTVVLAPRQNFVIDFQPGLGGFQFR